MKKVVRIDWENRGKTIAGLIKELQSFEDQNLFVEISIDGARTSYPISLVGKHGSKCILEYINNKSDDKK